MATATQAQTVEWHDVQGVVLRGYGRHPYSAHLFLQIDHGAQARAWLASICERVTTADHAQARLHTCHVNIAFTKSGLLKLGMPDTYLATFPTSFFEGMASPTRSRILGDYDVSAPEHWAWGGPGNDVDVILLIFAKDRAATDEAVRAEQAAFQGVSVKFGPIDTQLWDDGREHFGFHDGISQPLIEGSPPPAGDPTPVPANTAYSASNVIKAGEFLLGYLNEYGVLPDPLNLPANADPNRLLATVTLAQDKTAPDLGRNGSYLVIRQAAQDVPKLWNFLADATATATAESSADARAKLGAKLVGRWPGGAPIAVSPDRDDPARAEENEFLYHAVDPDGFGCPFGAHTRRANPRDTLGNDPVEALKLTKRHRLIRRGRSYGPRAANLLDKSDTQDRGLMFMCINANIERQFEFVQQTWVNNPSFNGLYNERDPIFGKSDDGSTGSMTIPRHPVRQMLHGLGGFVTIRGGAYFFLPGINALRYLAAMPGA
jgi:Dyp-type peroxidase family